MNRILNTIEGEPSLGVEMPTPTPPNPTLEGAVIDDQIEKPPEDSAVPPEMQDSANQGMIEESVLGGSPFDGALIGAGGADAPPRGMF
jgi:hypothetical protein